MSEDRLQAQLEEALGVAPTMSAPSPRFMGEDTQVALSDFPGSFAGPLKTLYEQFRAMADGQSSGAFNHDTALEGIEALRAAAKEIAGSDLSEASKHAVREAMGARFRAAAAHVLPWGRARITQDYSKQVRFVAGDLMRIWRQLFSGLDDTGLSTDRYTGAVAAQTVLLHWDRPNSDADPEGFAVEVRGSLSGRLASGAECAQFTRAVQALIDAAEARGASQRVVLDAADEPGLQRVALVAEGVAAEEGIQALTAAGGVSRAFGLQDAAAAVSARLVGEQAAEGGLVMWVRWPRLP